MDLANHPTPDLTEFAAECERKADELDKRYSDPITRAALLVDARIRDLRHIAADARYAMDGDDASMRSVEAWADENDLDLARSFERVGVVR